MEDTARDDMVLWVKTKEGQSVNIPVQGCLGLLAYGDLGLLAWRKTKQNQIKSARSNGSPPSGESNDREESS